MTTARELRLVIEARAAGLDDPTTATLVDFLRDNRNEAARAYALADCVRAVSGSTALLRHLLERGATVDSFVAAAAKHCNHVWRLPPSADRAIRATLTGG